MDDKIERITELLHKKFSSVYCDTCGNNEETCEECNRKSMLWSLSRFDARDIAKEIIEELNNG